MDIADFKAKILNPVADKPQLVGLANFHITNLLSAIAGLADLGHRVALEFAPAPAPEQFPKMLYRGSGIGPQDTMTVNDSEHVALALDDGWRESPTPVDQSALPQPTGVV